jgi:hypothetical protein
MLVTVVPIACGAPSPNAGPDPEGGSHATSGDTEPLAPDASSTEQTSTLDEGEVTSDGSTNDDTSDPPIDCNAWPELSPPWLDGYQREIVSALSGASVLPSGEVLSDRASPANRAESAAYLVEQLQALELEWFLHEYDQAGTNVYAHLPSTTGSETVVVLGAHYDTVPGSPGANDNATGVALVLAVARTLREAPCRDIGVVFVLFDQEEIGLVGSWHFAGLLVAEGVDVEAAHTIDQMGWDANANRAVELERADAGLSEIYEAAAAASGLLIPLVPTQTGYTDHVSFREWGLPAIGLTEEFVSGDTTPHYHLPGDTYETVSFAYLASTTTLVNAAFAQMLGAGSR